MTILLALLATGATAAFVARALTASRVRLADSLRQVDAYGFHISEPSESAPRVRSGLIGTIGRVYARRSSSVDLDELRRLLAQAGRFAVSPERIVGLRVLGVTLAPALMLFSAISIGLSPFTTILVTLISGTLGWRLPIVTLERRAQQRQQAIDRELPELIDLLVVTVEAGLGFTQSMQMASDRLRDPLGSELRLTLREQQMGRSIEDAMNALLERCDTVSMRSFVRSTLRGESLGVSIGTMLRNLAIDMRRIRRQNAEEKIQKAPIKILFPLVFLIFPALMLVVLAPAGFSVFDALG